MHMRHVVSADDVDLIHSLQFGDGALRDDNSILKHLGLCGDAAELAGSQQIVAVCERCCKANTASL